MSKLIPAEVRDLLSNYLADNLPRKFTVKINLYTLVIGVWIEEQTIIGIFVDEHKVEIVDSTHRGLLAVSLPLPENRLQVSQVGEIAKTYTTFRRV